MAEISRATLFGKLNPIMFKAAEGAVTFCKLRGNPHVDLTHWLFQIVNRYCLRLAMRLPVCSRGVLVALHSFAPRLPSALRAFVLRATESQNGILVGKRGAMIREIGARA